MLQLPPTLIERLYRKAQADRWQLSVEVFASALEASAAKAFDGAAPSARELGRYLESLRLQDVALACACAEGHPAAWDHFVLEYRPVLYRAADAMDPGGGAREAADSLYADLFGLPPETVRPPAATAPGGTGERRSLLRYFHGRSSLATWLRAVLAQRQVDRARASKRLAPLPDDEPEAAAASDPDPDRERYFALMHTALRSAVARLEPRDRLRLGYYYAQGLTLAQVGRLLREHEASVSRHLSAARKAVRSDVERQLSEAGLKPDEIAGCFEYVAQDAGPLDLDQLLEPEPARNAGMGVQGKESWSGKSVTP